MVRRKFYGSLTSLVGSGKVIWKSSLVTDSTIDQVGMEDGLRIVGRSHGRVPDFVKF